jgi:hypothetical protein
MITAEAEELARWHYSRQSIPDWLASGPDPDKVRASLARALDHPGRACASQPRPGRLARR